MEGRLRKEYVSIEVETKCSHCDLSIHITIASDMKFSVREPDAAPMVFTPDVDWENFAERSIIDAY